MKYAWVAVAVLVIAAGAWLMRRPEAEPGPMTDEAPAAGLPPARRAVADTASTPPARNPGQLAFEIERALTAVDLAQRETAFTQLMPELLRIDPQRAAALVARQQPGEVRDALRHEVARQWIRQDRDAAVAWIASLENEAERRDSATVAVRTLAARSTPEAIAVAEQLGVGRDDGSLEHMVQIWAAEDPDAAWRWIETQPRDDPRTQQLRARIEQVRASTHLEVEH